MSSPLDSLPLDHQPGTDNHVDLTLGEPLDEPRAPAQTMPARARHGQGLALGGAAVVSAAVALMGVWFLGQSGTAGTEEDAAVTVSYEPLEEARNVSPGPAVPDGPVPGGPAPASHETRATPPQAAAVPRREPAKAPAPAPADSVKRSASATGLEIITTPPGARVTVNGVGWGAAPLTLGHLSPGTKRVRVSMAGYESEERIVGADTNETKVTLRIRLRAAPRNRQPR